MIKQIKCLTIEVTEKKQAMGNRIEALGQRKTQISYRKWARKKLLCVSKRYRQKKIIQ